MKRYIYNLLESLEAWAMNDEDPMFISLLKMLLVIGGFIAVLAIGIALFLMWLNPDSHVVLNTTKTWSCKASHEEYESVQHGKIFRWEYVTECDVYERQPGHEHDWNH